ncbi:MULTISPECIES: hypothetical protein [Rhodococcus]|jgi:hypothetical protein|nr:MULTISPECIES: hypothetical protein [Rhodococcus]MBS2993605.1 hypothetical protein [Rhodococcus erythropolis]MCJ0901736.1 hypothetical protein [Rhodococcus sp. ARC_M13]MCJ0950651.1 hypothetical protein [Rhodococcus sp. ARC_M8]MDJ0435207.1 hypothetical protein [Rhodococcus qingshengii]MDJ0491473.1 hypothetical protein [Rhodococcus qingshengii]
MNEQPTATNTAPDRGEKIRLWIAALTPITVAVIGTLGSIAAVVLSR